MKIERRFTTDGADAYAGLGWRMASVGLDDPADADMSEPLRIEVPAGWSQTAADVLARNWLCRKSIPSETRAVAEAGVPEFLRRSVASENARFGGETSARQVFDRMAGAWGRAGWQNGYFNTEADARAYVDEIRHMLAAQMAAPGAPQWAKTGISWAYGQAGSSEDQFPQLWDRVTSAGPDDVSPDFMDRLRQRDRAASKVGAETTRRRATLQAALDADHPEIADFVSWKIVEEQKVASLVAGSRLLERHLNAILRAAEDGVDPKRNIALRRAVRAARTAAIPEGSIRQTLVLAAQGESRIEVPVFDTDWDGAAYGMVSGQRTETMVRVSDAFMEGATSGLDGAQGAEGVRTLWDRIGLAAWSTADPATMFRDTVAGWNTCPAEGHIQTPSLGGGHLFLDETGCGTAVINLCRFLKDGVFQAEDYAHAARLWTLTLDISVSMSGFPTDADTARSQALRPLGLGMTGLGSLLMRMGLAYDSPEGRAQAAALSALLTGTAYATSAELAGQVGAFDSFVRNREPMLRVVRNHARAAQGCTDGYEGLSIAPVPLDLSGSPDPSLAEQARAAWARAVALGDRHGFRNAQVTVTGDPDAVGLVMECAGGAIAPATGLVRYARLAGGEYLNVIDPAVPLGLKSLGYPAWQIDEIVAHVMGHRSLVDAPCLGHDDLEDLGFGPEQLDRIEAALGDAFDIRFVFNRWTLGRAFCEESLGLPAEALTDPAFDLLGYLGFSKDQIDQANAHVCGALSLEDAPHLAAEHVAVFDCAVPSGPLGSRRVSAKGQVAMRVALQSFISGDVGGAITLPNDASIADCLELHELAWRSGLKTSALQREGAGLSQTLATALLDEDEAETLAEGKPRDKTAVIAGKLAARELRSREALPQRRSGYARTARVAGSAVTLRTGEYQDGALGELFIEARGQRADIRAMMNHFALAVSVGLQHGVPLEDFVDAFSTPEGGSLRAGVGHDGTRRTTAVLDHVFRDPAACYIDRDRGAQAASDRPETADPKLSASRKVSGTERSFELLRRISATGQTRA